MCNAAAPQLELLTRASDSPCDAEPSAAKPTSEAAATDESEAAAPERPAATHAVTLNFTSVATAISAKESLLALSGDLTVSGVEYVVEPVASAEEIAALLPEEGGCPPPLESVRLWRSVFSTFSDQLVTSVGPLGSF